MKLPEILATVVVRAAKPGDSQQSDRDLRPGCVARAPQPNGGRLRYRLAGLAAVGTRGKQLYLLEQQRR